MVGRNDDFSHLDAAGRATALISRHPRAVVATTMGLAVALAWASLFAMATEAARFAVPGTDTPGDGLLRLLPALPLPDAARRLFELCLSPAPLAAGFGARAAALAAMWLLMAMATMLPSAAPMIRTYCEIADTARLKGEPVVHPLVLVGGYLTVWAGASIAFALLTLGIEAAGDSAGALAPVRGMAGAAALALAGAYQFSGIKNACLVKCRNPFTTLFANWSSSPRRIFRIGLAQGVWCLGCCWALMLVMFAVGVTNIFWMALIGLFALLEKQGNGQQQTRLAGTILLVWAAALLLVSL